MKSKHLLFFLFFPFFLLAQPKKGTGLVVDMPSLRGTPYKAKLTLKSYKSVPAAASLEKYTPVPGDQGQYSTCVAFATAYHLRTILWAKQNNITDKSKLNEHIFSPTFVYEQIKDDGDNDCQGGSNPIMAFELLKNLGVSTLRTMPYNCGGSVGTDAMLEGFDFRISDYQVLFLPEGYDNDTKINTTKKSLAEGYPVMLGFVVPESFYTAETLWEPQSTDDGPSGAHGRHAMCVVGYDDNKYDGAFRVMNSWGSSWGDGGFVWIKYKDYADYSILGLQAYPAVQEEPAPEPDPAPSPAPEPKPVPKPLPTPEPKDVVLKGKVEFTLNTGETMTANRILTRNLIVEEENGGNQTNLKEDLVAYRMDNAYTSGTKFRFFITTNTESYIYAFATDKTGVINKILPFDDLMSPHIGPNSTVAFPSETKIVKMDSNPGTDYLLILYAPEPLNTQLLLAAMNNTPGGLSAKVSAALGDKLMLPSDVRYQLNEIGFEVNGAKTGTVVPLMVEITHN